MSVRAQPTGIEVVAPAWSVPPCVQARFTLRGGGVSAPPFDSLNLATHVGDAPEAVAENRRRLRSALALPGEPAWMQQVHGCGVVELGATARPGATEGLVPVADAALSRCPECVCVVQVADCLPVLFAAADGAAVAIAHAGWRGLAAGVLEATVAKLGVEPQGLIAWLGPAIGRGHFEVGAEVRGALLARDPGSAGAFTANARGRWQCDLAALARRRLAALGLRAVHGGTWCTYADRARFFSYRRDGQCGRMAALIWLA